MEKSHNGKNKANKIRTKEVKSPYKNSNTHSETITKSPSKQKLQNKKKDSPNSNEDLDTNDKRTVITSKKLNFTSMLTTPISPSTSKDENSEKQSPNKRKAKEVDLFEERGEKKKQRALQYEKYLQRGGARNPGSKTIPTVRIYIYLHNCNYI